MSIIQLSRYRSTNDPFKYYFFEPIENFGNPKVGIFMANSGTSAETWQKQRHFRNESGLLEIFGNPKVGIFMANSGTSAETWQKQRHFRNESGLFLPYVEQDNV